MPEKVGIVICAWNCVDQVRVATESAVETCVDSGIPFKILIHDDHSELEPLEEEFKKWEYPHTHYFRQPARGGLTRAWNTGISWAIENECSLVALCNQDILFAQDWLPRFVKDLESCFAISPLTNSPGLHSDATTLQGQDVRKFVPELAGSEISPTKESLALIMERIKLNRPFEVRGIKGFFMGFRIDWLIEHQIEEGEYYSMKKATVNQGVGGSENEIFRRTGTRPSIAADVYVHHFRPRGNDRRGLAREIFRRFHGDPAAARRKTDR